MTTKTPLLEIPYMPADSVQLWKIFNWSMDIIDTKYEHNLFGAVAGITAHKDIDTTKLSTF